MGDLLNRYRIVNMPDGSSNMTRIQYTGLTPDTFYNMGKTEYNKQRMIAEAVESSAVGVVMKPLEELLMSRIKELGKGALTEHKVPGSGSIILPYRYRRRKTNIPGEDFVVTAGTADSTISAYGWKLTVQYSPKFIDASKGFGGAALTYLARYFKKGEYIYIEHMNSAGVAGTDRDVRLTALEVLDSSDSTATTAYVIVKPCFSSLTAWNALTAAQKAVHNPTFGYIHLGVNSVHDEEAYAQNQPSNLTNSLIADWIQTTRYTQYYNDKYKEMLDKVISGEINDFQSAFMNIPLAEQNKQAQAIFRRKLLNTIIYGQAINENQTVEGYTNLPQVIDPDDSTPYHYKANVLGLRTLLANDSQVVDMHGGQLDLKMVFDLAWKVKRNREANGESHEVICFMTDKDTARDIDIQILTACKNLYGENITRYYEKGELRGNDGEHRYTYKKYDIPGLDFQLAIFIEPYLTDRIYNFGKGTGGVEGSVTGFDNVGRQMWAVDWNDFEWGIIATNQAKREYKGDTYSNANALYATVITPNTKHYELRSTTFTTGFGDTKRSLIIENFSTVATLTL